METESCTIRLPWRQQTVQIGSYTHRHCFTLCVIETESCVDWLPWRLNAVQTCCHGDKQMLTGCHGVNNHGDWLLTRRVTMKTKDNKQPWKQKIKNNFVGCHSNRNLCRQVGMETESCTMRLPWRQKDVQIRFLHTQKLLYIVCHRDRRLCRLVTMETEFYTDLSPWK